MKILIMGGTGAMGTPLQRFLLEYGYEVHVTSRIKHEDEEVIYHCGNAHDEKFLFELLKEGFDSIVDFMSYETGEFLKRVGKILSCTDQYIFISSSRVYAATESVIKEDTPRLLDVCDDPEYLKTDEYALTKARQEDLLKNSGMSNWTIIRPSLTYNPERLQYAIGEKEEWLYRYLQGEKIVFPKNMSDIQTTMSWGNDVAHAIALIVGNKKAMGETVHIAGAKAITWNDVNQIYVKVLADRFGNDPEIFYVDDWQKIGKALGRYYQLKYARSISRRFDNSKLESIVGKIEFVPPEEGLSRCLNEFLDGEMKLKKISCRSEAYFNKLTGDRNTSFRGKDRLKYIVGRYTTYLEWKR